MDGTETWLLICCMLILFKWYRAPCDVSLHPVLYTWPLGEGIFSYEINNQSWSGDHHNIRYNTGPSALGYHAVEFNASAESYIEFPVQDYNSSVYAKPDEYAISFFPYVESDGVFLHYKSDDYGGGTGLIESIKFEMVAGNIHATLFSSVPAHGEARATFNTTVAYNKWFPIVFRRDLNHDKIQFMLETGVKIEAPTTSWVKDADTSFPGTLRFGGSMDGESHFSGRVACVQMIPCKDPPVNGSYTADCSEANWPFTSSTTTTTTASPTSPTSTPTTPIITPTAMSNAMPTPTTTTITPTPTTPTSTPTTPTVTPTVMPTTMPTPTTTTPATPTPQTNPVPQANVIPTTCFANCRRYQRVNQDVNFTAGEALDVVMNINSPQDCSEKCSRHGSCWSFVFKPGGCCWLGPSSPGTTTETGADLYEVVLEG